MFIKYEKIYRIPIKEILIGGKFCLSRKEVRLLLAGKVTIEEKIDGANVGIIRHKNGFALQKRGSLVGQSEHEQFQYLYNWANRTKYDNIMAIPPGHLIYGEWCYAVHSIYYDRLPDYFLVFDILKDKRKWLNREERDDFCAKYELASIPFIAEGHFNITDLCDLIPGESAYGDMAEGIVLKRYRKREYIRGKIVKPQFIKTLEESEHWTKYNIRENKLQL